MYNIDDIELGDTCEYSGNLFEVSGLMKGLPPLQDTVFYFYKPKGGHPVNMGVPVNLITNLIKKPKLVIDKCTCDSLRMSWEGCKCGHFQREQSQKL